MRGFGLVVLECNGHRKRTAITADNYEELAEKIAEKAGIRLPVDEDLLTDGGEE